MRLAVVALVSTLALAAACTTAGDTSAAPVAPVASGPAPILPLQAEDTYYKAAAAAVDARIAELEKNMDIAMKYYNAYAGRR